MERKMARFTAFFTCAFSLFICVAVWFLPELEQRIEAYSASIRRDQLAREERYALLEKMSGLEIMDYNTQQVQQQAEKAEKEEKEIIKEGGDPEPQEDVIVITHQMQLELPSGADASNVEVVHDLIERRIDIRIPGADKNYIYDYMVLGESGDMESLDYFSEGDSGTVALTMDKVVEADYSFDENYLYLDFLSPAEMHDRIIVVDAGHGGGAPGAVSGTHYEKNITLAIVQQLKKLFDEADDPQIGVYYTRLDDTNPSLSDRVGLANELNADLFVSVHVNSSVNNAIYGVETHWWKQDSVKYAETVHKHLGKNFNKWKTKDRGLFKSQFYVINHTEAPAILVEIGFISNADEREAIITQKRQSEIAKAITDGVMEYLKTRGKEKE